MLLFLLMSSRATSAAGIAPEELKPNSPNEVISMKVKFCSAADPLGPVHVAAMRVNNAREDMMLTA